MVHDICIYKPTDSTNLASNVSIRFYNKNNSRFLVGQMGQFDALVVIST